MSRARAPHAAHRALLGTTLLAFAAACGDTGTPAGDGLSPGGAAADRAGAPADVATAEVWFVDVATEAGVDFVYASGHDGERFWMPEIMGGGAALFDADGDGRLDLYLVQGGRIGAPGASQPANRLYRNATEAGGPLRFDDVTEGSGADDRGYGMGATAGDADNDGDVDLYVTNWGPNVLLLNDGDGRFTDASAASGAGHPGWGMSAAFVDIEADGDLDLFVVNYLDWTPAGELTCHNELGRLDYCSPQNYESPARDVLLRNDGGAVFTDVSAASGVSSKPATGLGVGCGDFDLDGRIDVFVANDGMPDALWRNLGDGTFEDIADLAGCAVDDSGRPKAGMGVALNDADDDGDLDLLVCNLAGQSDSLYLNQGGWFRDKTTATGLTLRSKASTRFGMGLLDLDLDGALDLFQANGRVMVGPRAFTADPFAEPDLLLRGVRDDDGDPRLEPVATPDGTADAPAWTSRAAAFGDLDDDGGVDIVVVARDGPARVLRNLIAPRQQAAPDALAWIGFRVLDAHGRDALGATLTLRAGTGSADDGSAPGAGAPRRTVTRDVRAAFSYLASSDPRVHVALGEGVTVVTGVSVTWVDGTVEAFGDLDGGAYHELRRGAGASR